MVSCKEPTEHFSSGCAMLLHYDKDKDGIISEPENEIAAKDWQNNILNDREISWLTWARLQGTINDVCPGCYTKPSPYTNIITIIIIGVALYIFWTMIKRKK